MLVEKDIKKILGELEGKENIHIAYDGSDIEIGFLEDASKLSMMTSVYSGGNYIPSSVRQCLSHKSPITNPSIKTYLTIDENHFQVHLHYLGHAEPLTYYQFKEILEEFGFIAERWREFLDEHDRNDLVYVRAK